MNNELVIRQKHLPSTLLLRQPLTGYEQWPCQTSTHPSIPIDPDNLVPFAVLHLTLPTTVLCPLAALATNHLLYLIQPPASSQGHSPQSCLSDKLHPCYLFEGSVAICLCRQDREKQHLLQSLLVARGEVPNRIFFNDALRQPILHLSAQIWQISTCKPRIIEDISLSL